MEVGAVPKELKLVALGGLTLVNVILLGVLN